MPIHDWARVDAGIFHDFHVSWIASIRHALNAGLLPPEYYALAEQFAGPGKPDVLTLQSVGGLPADPHPDDGMPPGGGLSLAAAPPKVSVRDQADAAAYVRATKTVVVRHSSGDRVVALVEVVSWGNKAGRAAVRSIVEKTADYLRDGVHLLVLDLHPPGPRDPQGVHPLIWSEFKRADFTLPPGKPLTVAAYAAGLVKQAFVEPVAVGDRLPDMPLFLTPDVYVNVPLEATYQAAWAEVPRRWQRVLDPAAS